MIQGRSEQAMQAIAAAVAEAWAIRHLPSLAYALSEAACPGAIINGDLELAQTYVDLLVEGSRDRGMEAWRNIGRFYSGWLLSRQGAPGAALPILREALAELRGSRHFPVVARAFSQAAGAVGDPDVMREGLAALDAALLRAEQGEERWLHSELLRAKAELLIAQDGPDAIAAASQLLRAAAELARSQGALRFELWAATSLARIETRSPATAQARAALADTLARFDEGFDTPDLVLARRLLASADAATPV
jgi:predicted ATPase